MNSLHASTQYGDYAGTISIDGFAGPFLDRLLCSENPLPEGFIAVGLTYYLPDDISGVRERGDFQEAMQPGRLAVLAVKAESWDAIRERVTTEGKLDVVKFRLDRLTLRDVLPHMKRAEIVIMGADLQAAKISLIEES